MGESLAGEGMSNIQPRQFSATAAEITVRILTADDGAAFRNVRLEALKREGELFGPTFDNESKKTPQQWSDEAAATPDKAIFGLFHGQQLIGITRAKRDDDDPTGATTLWGATYLKPAYRGQGIAAGLYRARMEWTQQHPRYTTARCFILPDNLRSIHNIEQQGAVLTASKPIDWPDRPARDWNWYEIPIVKEARRAVA
jgi:RimJ/RimL family protein N-acetyltransferase